MIKRQKQVKQSKINTEIISVIILYPNAFAGFSHPSYPSGKPPNAVCPGSFDSEVAESLNLPVRRLLGNVRARGDNVFLNVCTVTSALEKISSFYVKCIASAPLTTHQSSAQSVQPFPRCGKGCARTHVRVYPTINFCKTLS